MTYSRQVLPYHKLNLYENSKKRIGTTSLQWDNVLTTQHKFKRSEYRGGFTIQIAGSPPAFDRGLVRGGPGDVSC